MKRKTITYNTLKKLIREALETSQEDENSRYWLTKLSRNKNVLVLTPRKMYKEYGFDSEYDSVEDFCQNWFDMSSHEIKWTVGVSEESDDFGSNEDCGVVTKYGTCYIYGSGHGSKEVTPKELYDWFCS